MPKQIKCMPSHCSNAVALRLCRFTTISSPMLYFITLLETRLTKLFGLCSHFDARVRLDALLLLEQGLERLLSQAEAQLIWE